MPEKKKVLKKIKAGQKGFRSQREEGQNYPNWKIRSMKWVVLILNCKSKYYKHWVCFDILIDIHIYLNR